MKRLTLPVVVALCGMLQGCAESPTQSGPAEAKVNRKHLLDYGFKLSNIDPDRYELDTTKLADVLRDLGISLADFEPGVNAPGFSDCRVAKLNGWAIVIDSRAKNEHGRAVRLEQPNTLCNVVVLVNQPPPPEYRKTDSTPHMRIKSVKVLRHATKPLEVTFELAARGTTPLALESSPRQFSLRLVRQGEPLASAWAIDHSRGMDASFPEGTARRITVLPGKPITLTLTADLTGSRIAIGPWSDLRPGKYVVAVAIGYAKPEGPYFDYHWVGDNLSDEYEFTIK